MNALTVTLPDDIKRRLEALASVTGQSLDEVLTLAVFEFVETWERHLNDVSQISEDEVRFCLKAAVND